MHCHCGNNNRAPRWTFTDPCKPDVRLGAREKSASPACLAAPAMNAHDTTKVYKKRLTLDVDRHYIGSVTATTHQEKAKRLSVNPVCVPGIKPAIDFPLTKEGNFNFETEI